MDINVFWHKQLNLEDGSDDNMIYTVQGIERFDEVPGVYMFCRKYKDKIIPLYIGKALNLAARIEQQLNTTKLMKAIENSSSGTRVLVIGEFQAKPGQQKDKCIRMVEKALVNHALAEECELINQQGTKTPYHEISFTGNARAKAFSGPAIYMQQRG